MIELDLTYADLEPLLIGIAFAASSPGFPTTAQIDAILTRHVAQVSARLEAAGTSSLTPTDTRYHIARQLALMSAMSEVELNLNLLDRHRERASMVEALTATLDRMPERLGDPLPENSPGTVRTWTNPQARAATERASTSQLARMLRQGGM